MQLLDGALLVDDKEDEFSDLYSLQAGAVGGGDWLALHYAEGGFFCCLVLSG